MTLTLAAFIIGLLARPDSRPLGVLLIVGWIIYEVRQPTGPRRRRD